jgi:hypothetical protein
MHKKCVIGAGRLKIRILLFSLLGPLCFTIMLYAQDEEYLNIVTLEEPSWVYKARGDRFYREGKYGNALAMYKKAIIRRKQGGSNQKIDGIDIEMGLSRQGGNLNIYLKKLDRFRIEHEETSGHVVRALRESRYDEARSLIQTLQRDAFDIGAKTVKEDAEALDRSIYVRKYAEWNYLQERLFESNNGERQGSLTIVLKSLNEQYIDNIDSSDPKLRLQIEGNAPYPEAHLKIAQIYLEEGLFDLSLQQLDMAEEGQEHFQIPDLIFSVLYTRAENYRTRAEFYKEHGNKKGFNREADKYGRELDRIVEKDENWRGGKEGAGFKGYKDIKLYEIPNGRVLNLSGDAVGREKYGKAYFLSGEYKFQNGRDEGAEPYLIMAFLYGYERETAKRYLEQYYTLRNDTANLKKIEDIEALFR